MFILKIRMKPSLHWSWLSDFDLQYNFWGSVTRNNPFSNKDRRWVMLIDGAVQLQIDCDYSTSFLWRQTHSPFCIRGLFFMYNFQTQIQNHYLISFLRLPQIITSGVKINVASHSHFHYRVQQNIMGADSVIHILENSLSSGRI